MGRRDAPGRGYRAAIEFSKGGKKKSDEMKSPANRPQRHPQQPRAAPGPNHVPPDRVRRLVGIGCRGIAAIGCFDHRLQSRRHWLVRPRSQ